MAKITTSFRLSLTDGREYTGRILPVDIAAAERFFGGIQDKPIQGTFFGAYHALTKRAGNDLGKFSEFLEALDEFEDSEESDEGGEGAPSGEGEAPASATSSP